MARFLFTTLPSNDLGLLTRSLPIARELSEHGHEIAFSSPGKAPSKLISEAGFKNLTPPHPLYYISTSDLNFKGLLRLIKHNPMKSKNVNIFNFLFQLFKAIPFKFAPSTPEVWNMNHATAIAGMLNTNFIKANCNAYLKLIDEFRPDIIVDFWNPFACIAARILKKPLISVLQVDAHPANKGFIWWKEPPANLPSAAPAINKVLTGYGLKPISKVEELSLGNLTLIIGMPETDPLTDKAEGIYIGPILWQNDNNKLPVWIDNIKDNKPLIWVYSGNPRYTSKGTAYDSEIILTASIEALANEDVHVIVTTGHHMLPKNFLPLPKNFHFAIYVPGLTLAERCDLMIHHGGYGSCQTGLYSGTSAVIIPTFSERESNARRIASLGAGEFVLPETDASGKKHISIDEFKTKIKQVLNTPSYTENAKNYRKKLRSYGGTKYAVQLIETFEKEIYKY